MQKFSQFHVTYRNIMQFDRNFWKLDYFEKSVLELLAYPVWVCQRRSSKKARRKSVRTRSSSAAADRSIFGPSNTFANPACIVSYNGVE